MGEITDNVNVNVIREGDTVLFDVNDRVTFLVIRPKTKVKMGRAYVPVGPLIGCLYGTLFTLSADGKSLEPAPHVPNDDWAVPDEDNDVNRNNELKDAGKKHQQLSHHDISELKTSGIAGTEIVDALLSNSVTFAQKTTFSQEKYKKKKARKYILTAVARRPTAATVATALYATQASKIGCLRPDTLSVALSLANVGAHARVLVLETCTGLLTAAVAERLGGYGLVCSTYTGNKPPSTAALKHFNFDQRTMDSMNMVPLSQLLGLYQPSSEVDATEPAAATEGQGNDTTMGEACPRTSNAAADSSCSPPFDSCLIAAQGTNPLAIMRTLIPLLSPSANFAIVSPWQQPLATCLDALRADGTAVNMLLQESWMRKHQILPKRTHPLMNMDHGGGYILSGTVVLKEIQQYH